MNGEINVFSPAGLHELLLQYYENPDALLFAGGTYIMTVHDTVEQILPEKVISLSGVEELRKIKRTEKFLEIGSMVTYSKLLSIGRHVIPKILYSALSLSATPALRNSMTIGGNLAVASPYSTLYPALFALDAVVEIRNLSGSLWLPVTRFISRTGKSVLKSGNLITKIRIPIGAWDFQVFRKAGARVIQRYPAIVFAGLGRVNKGVLTDVRLSFGACGPFPFRSREFELAFSGIKLPFDDKETQHLLTDFETRFQPVADRFSTEDYRKKTAVRLVGWFIDEINHIDYQID